MKKIIVFTAFLLLCSCGKAFTRWQVSRINNSFLIQHHVKDGKDVLFIPMIHLNTAENFKKIKSKVDSLRSIGYAVYYEGVDFKKPLDSLTKDVVCRKFKSVTGILPFDYFDKRNKQSRNLAVKGYVIQSAENTGIDIRKDLRADLPLDALVALYEKEKGEIKLSECDLKTGLLEKYKCKKVNKNNSAFMILKLRNRYLSYCINSSKDKKIVVLYGARHGDGLEKELQNLDPNWKYIVEYSSNYRRL